MTTSPFKLSSEDEQTDFAELCDRILVTLLSGLDIGKGTVIFPAVKSSESESASHIHLEPELLIQLEGQSTISVPGRNYTVNPGELFFLPSLTAHNQETKLIDGQFSTFLVLPYKENIYFQLASTRFKNSRRADRLKEFYVGVREQLFANSGSLSNSLLLERIIKESKDYCSSDSVIKGAMQIYLAQLREVLKRQAAPFTGHPLVIRQALHIINVHYANPTLCVKNLAQQCKCSPNYLSGLFTKETGEKLTDYLNKIRLDNSIEMLRSTNLTVAEIAFHSGYESANYFIRLFKRKYGVTPASYRKAHS